MWRSIRPLTHSASLFCSKRFLSGSSLSSLMQEAAQLTENRAYEKAQAKYKAIMSAYPNYEPAYKEYYFLEYKIVGPYGLTQSLWNHLQQNYLKAVEKYGEYSETSKPTLK